MKRPRNDRLQAEIERGLALSAFLNDPHVMAWFDGQERVHQAKLLNPNATDAELRAAQVAVLAIQGLRAEMRHAAATGRRAEHSISENRASHD